MTGSDKQIEWASKIKAEKLQDMETVIRVMTSGADRSNPIHLAHIQKIEAAAESLRTEESAKFWIDNRLDTLQALVRSRVK